MIEQANIQPASPAVRRNVLILLGCTVIAGFMLIWWLQDYLASLQRQASNDPQAAMDIAINLLKATGLAGGAIFGSLGVWLLLLGRKIFTAGRYPPPGMQVIRDTPVCTGGKARLKAYTGMALGLASLVMAVGIFVVMWRTLASLA